MITIKLDTSKSGGAHVEDTLRSLKSNVSDEKNYRVVFDDESFPLEGTRVVITIPADAICLAAKWDMYFIYDLDNDKVIDVREVIKRMMLTGHRESTLSQEIFVEYLTT